LHELPTNNFTNMLDPHQYLLRLLYGVYLPSGW